ncbi:MAG: hypothetical protein K0R44_46 [Thermomicrobiales bacterium]|jgi:hypothetical protein|nr:hypothetical protein [Thermomicrobiales bacterium]MDF3014821.1 hypothetical protein [Thermomicrobiales bacterium]
MGDRNLTEPTMAMQQMLTGLRDGQARTRNRQRWQGAIQPSAPGSGSSITDGNDVALASLVLDPGSWFLMVRIGVEISSGPGTATFIGSERMTALLRTYLPDSSSLLEVVDQETLSPSVVADTSSGGFYAGSLTLFGPISYDDQVEVRAGGRIIGPDDAGRFVSWHSTKIMALPF